jgi:hypothetical protein
MVQSSWKKWFGPVLKCELIQCKMIYNHHSKTGHWFVQKYRMVLVFGSPVGSKLYLVLWFNLICFAQENLSWRLVCCIILNAKHFWTATSNPIKSRCFVTPTSNPDFKTFSFRNGRDLNRSHPVSGLRPVFRRICFTCCNMNGLVNLLIWTLNKRLGKDCYSDNSNILRNLLFGSCLYSIE